MNRELAGGTNPTAAIDTVQKAGTNPAANAAGVPLSLLGGENIAIILNGGSLGELTAGDVLGDGTENIALLFCKGGLIGEASLLGTPQLSVHFLDSIEGKVTQVGSTGTDYRINATGDKEGIQQAVSLSNLQYF